jgi:hypothetical protein
MFEKLITKFKKSPTAEGEQGDDASTGITEVANQAVSVPEDQKKKGSMVIRIIIVLGLAYYGLTEFVLKEDAPEKQEKVVAKKPRKNKNANNDAKKDDAAIADQKPIDPNSEKNSDKAPEKLEEKSPATDVVVEPAKETIKEEVKEVVKEEDKIISSKVIDTNEKNPDPPIENINVLPKNEPVKVNIGESQKDEKQIDKNIDKMIESENASSKTTEVDLKDKIVVEDVYVEPPSYEVIGRGLVYNCKDKFWVCIDKPSYVTCNKNMKYNKSHGKKAECVVQNVYNNSDDCSLVQKYNVNNLKSTDFCN